MDYVTHNEDKRRGKKTKLRLGARRKKTGRKPWKHLFEKTKQDVSPSSATEDKVYYRDSVNLSPHCTSIDISTTLDSTQFEEPIHLEINQICPG
ncbi:unnamed protein product [Timema podura]|uniref:Uncharacterized protein n=1 Tax=Timema podura TaxID=61482 RepID=A0ABN7PMA9_TIMPD|nr:unnamed protein product [Timema podura]